MSKVYLDSVPALIEKAGEIRKKLALTAHKNGNIHLGGPFSSADVAVALYYKHLGFDPDNLEDPNRNTFILSKGHSGVLLYTIFCDMGMYDWDLLLENYNTIGGVFGPHPSKKHIKGIEATTGSLGHGLSLSIGIAHANRNQKIDARIYCLVGDGEMEEGSNWEAIMYASSKKLDNIVAIVDYNKGTASFDENENIVWTSMADAYRAFGWEVYEIDGSNMKEIDETLAALPPVNLENPGKPICIIANTTKGQGAIQDGESPSSWHIRGFDAEGLKDVHEAIDAYTAAKLKEVY